MRPSHSAAYWKKTLALECHPEGGWFVESYRSGESISPSALPERYGGARAFSTAIHFLLEGGGFSALHRLKSDEMWHFYSGDPLLIHIITSAGVHETILLGSDPGKGQRFQAVVPAGCWFGAECEGGYSLVGCTVAPGFDFSDFEMASRDLLSEMFPHHAALIGRLTRAR
jgi:predicted cupin superfamily sugar epimerase